MAVLCGQYVAEQVVIEGAGMSHIFISYNHEDNDFSDNLLHRLHDASFTTWRDGDKLHAGEVWRQEIDQAIQDALVMIVIMTPAAKNSEYVTYEWAFALGVGVKVIPLMLKSTELHPRLRDIQYLDFTGRIRPWQQLIETVHAVADTKDHAFTIPRNTPLYIKNAFEALNSPNPSDREGGIAILVKARNHPIAQKALSIALKHDLRDVRIQSSLSVARFPDMQVQALPGLFQALRMKQYNSQATEALGKMGQIAISDLIIALDDKVSFVRSGAAKALGMIKDNSVVPNLLNLSNNKESYEVRRSAIVALGAIGDDTALLGLLDALHREQDALNSVTESIGSSNIFSGEEDLETYEDLRLEQRDIDEFIDGIVDKLSSSSNAVKPILIKNLHENSCQACSKLIEGLKRADRF